MNTVLKIRLLIALLCFSLLLTATLVQKTYTPKINLDQTAGMLESNLHYKEEFIQKTLAADPGLRWFKSLAENDTAALKAIKTITTDNRIWVNTFSNNQLSFWSGVKILPQSPLDYKEGISFVKVQNGYYEAVKKTSGNFAVLFFIPVKLTYPYQNRYLKNAFDRDILNEDNIDIAAFSDKNVTAIHSIDNSYLFSVKLKPDSYNRRFIYSEVILWALGLLTLCLFVHIVLNYAAQNGYVYFALAGLALFIVGLRFLNLDDRWPSVPFHFEIFGPKAYAASKIFPSLGDFCINIFCLCWFTAFLYQHRYKLVKGNPGKGGSYAIMLVCAAALLYLSSIMVSLFYGLDIHSHINFDVTNVFNLTGFSIIGVVVLCFSFFLFYLFTDAALVATKNLAISANIKISILAAAVAVATGITLYRHDFTFFYILVGLFIGVRAASVWFGNGRLSSSSLVGLIVICSAISSSKLNHFQAIKERDIRKLLIEKLEDEDDNNAEYLFSKIQHDLVTDHALAQYFSDTLKNDDDLKNYFQKTYFDGYLSKYAVKTYVFNNQGLDISGDRKYTLNDFKDLVMYSSFKVSDFFYRENDSFGLQSYFAILPVFSGGKSLGTVVIDLKSKPLFVSSSFPELLNDGSSRPEEAFKDYSFAFYSDNHLLSESGRYVYSLVNNDFKGELKKYIFTETRGKTSVTDNDRPWFDAMISYSHLIYQPSPRYLIVVSKEENWLELNITSLTFFFVILLAFSSMVVFIAWIWTRIRLFSISNDEITWAFRINLDNILYKNRIQFSVICTVVITLLIVGFITFRSISSEYKVQQDNMIHDKLNSIAAVFESGLEKGIYSLSAKGQAKFNEFADTYQADLTLYNVEGIPLLTTQPKIFEYGLIARRMNGKAFINMRKLQRSEFLNEEFIGESNYKAAYVPILNAKNSTVAYLQLPYFANEADYNARIGALLNAMINIYAVVFIAIGLFAVIIARQITAPLNFIQYNLSKTIYGKKNEPIKWDRNDEIGSLVKEYNKMISALEDSAQKLAQSERESAWREMAKQVAHEIKNPLTPLKLGLQLLDKSWRDKDPKFDQKFERFSKSFVEQIESLSSIASEFSAFAKMPDTRLERINIFDMIGQAVTIFKQMDNISIYFTPGDNFYIRADRDQLLRCFNNLLKNAIEAIPAGRMGKIEITHRIVDNNILILLSDNGNGIPGNMREKIFEPNFTTKSSGTGLGLAFVKSSIENAGGKVWYDTVIDHGTTFYLSLPAA